MKRDDLVRELDCYFWIADVRNDDWSDIFEVLYPEPYWRDYVEPGYEGRWNGLMVRGSDKVERVATCVFPTPEIVDGLDDDTFLFSEHPIDDAPGDLFTGLPRETFERMRDRGIGLYHAHGPLDHHPDVSPSRLLAGALGIEEFEEYFPIADGIPGAAAVVGECGLSVGGIADRLRDVLGPEIPVRVLAGAGREAGRVAIVAGGGAQVDMLEESLARGCTTYVTGNAASPCPVPDVRASVEAFNELAAERGVAVVDGTHYGTEKLPQLAMVEWFRARGLEARFVPGRPERDRASRGRA